MMLTFVRSTLKAPAVTVWCLHNHQTGTATPFKVERKNQIKAGQITPIQSCKVTHIPYTKKRKTNLFSSSLSEVHHILRNMYFHFLIVYVAKLTLHRGGKWWNGTVVNRGLAPPITSAAWLRQPDAQEYNKSKVLEISPFLLVPKTVASGKFATIKVVHLRRVQPFSTRSGLNAVGIREKSLARTNKRA